MPVTLHMISYPLSFHRNVMPKLQPSELLPAQALYARRSPNARFDLFVRELDELVVGHRRWLLCFIKEHTLTHLDRYLEEFEANAIKKGNLEA
jgi:hypothetical protein